MAGYGKKIVYLSCMDMGEKIKSVGFIRVGTEGEKCRLDMKISGMELLPDDKYDVCAIGFEGREYVLGSIWIEKGRGEWNKEIDILYEDIKKFSVRVSDSIWLEGKSGNEKQTKYIDAELKAGWMDEQVQESQVEKEEEKSRSEQETPLLCTTPKGIDINTIILNDKWEQLQQIYPVIHPYEDDRQYISIQPKDFVIMTGDYQHLANNSFLLHGYYNYRHIILGHEEEGQSFYLGVPGVYYEREKMVALMFGFEAFECSGGKAEPGKFGYYLRKVKI